MHLEDTDRLDRLLEKILIAARIDNSEVPIHPEDMDHRQQFKNALISYCAPIRIEIYRKRLKKVYMYILDPWAFNSIVNNLLENALIYSPKEEPVKVVLRKEGNKVLCS